LNGDIATRWGRDTNLRREPFLDGGKTCGSDKGRAARFTHPWLTDGAGDAETAVADYAAPVAEGAVSDGELCFNRLMEYQTYCNG